MPIKIRQSNPTLIHPTGPINSMFDGFNDYHARLKGAPGQKSVRH